jgi:hypothetical protein
MPGNLIFSATVDWNGTPGTARFQVAGRWISATTTDIGNGLSKASLQIAAPESIASCSELIIEVVNGNQTPKTTTVKTGVYFSPIPFLIGSWYSDNINWTPSGTSLAYSRDYLQEIQIPLPTDAISLGGSFGGGWGLKYDLMSATFQGSGKLEGGVDAEVKIVPSPYKVYGSGKLGFSGSLGIHLPACKSPEITPSWTVSPESKIGIGAPVVTVVDLGAPGLGTTLAQVPFIKDAELQLYVILGGSLSSEYKNFTTGDCWFGATGIIGELTGGETAPGDVNVDGNVDLADAVIALKIVAGMETTDGYAQADTSGDGRIGIEEVVYILQKVAGLR